MIDGLTSLEINGLRDSTGSEWPCKIIARNHKTLKHLRLGRELDLAENQAKLWRARQAVGRRFQLPGSFQEAVRNGLLSETPDLIPTLCLETLQLCGLDLSPILQGPIGLHFDFENLKVLKLESCINLVDALSQKPDIAEFIETPQLTTLFIRHELTARGSRFRTFLSTFLISLSGLQHLEVLLDRTRQHQNLAAILDVHGKTLRSFSWQERSEPRRSMKRDTSIVPRRLQNLEVVAQKCPYLRSLGLPLEWKALTGSGTRSGKCTVRKIQCPIHITCAKSSCLTIPQIQSAFRNMQELQHFHIRNMPEMEDSNDPSPVDYALKCSAVSFVDAVSSAMPPGALPQLKTFAIGASLYKDVHVGAGEFYDPLADFLRIRIYHVDFCYPSPVGPSTVVSLMAKGTSSELWNLGIRDYPAWPYWLT